MMPWKTWISIRVAHRSFGSGDSRKRPVCIAVRDTHGLDANNPLPFFAVKQRIEAALSAATFHAMPPPSRPARSR